jgi:hypothetical protein
MWLENLLQTLHSYFAHSPKKHLEFTKLIEFIEKKREQDCLKCENEIDLDVQPC